VNPITTIVLIGVCLALACIGLFWAINRFKTDTVRSYQINELGINDPIAIDLKELAIKYADLQDDIDAGIEPDHVPKALKMRKEMVRLGREIKRLEAASATTSSCGQQI